MYSEMNAETLVFSRKPIYSTLFRFNILRTTFLPHFINLWDWLTSRYFALLCAQLLLFCFLEDEVQISNSLSDTINMFSNSLKFNIMLLIYSSKYSMAKARNDLFHKILPKSMPFSTFALFKFQLEWNATIKNQNHGI